MREFWKAAFVRAGHTAAQVALAMIPATATMLEEVPWLLVLETAALSAVISLLKSCVIGMPEVPKGDGGGA